MIINKELSLIDRLIVWIHRRHLRMYEVREVVKVVDYGIFLIDTNTNERKVVYIEFWNPTEI